MLFAAKPIPDDKVAVVSPSGGLPEVFPAPYELGLQRLRAFGLEPVEYPSTRKLRSTPRSGRPTCTPRGRTRTSAR